MQPVQAPGIPPPSEERVGEVSEGQEGSETNLPLSYHRIHDGCSLSFWMAEEMACLRAQDIILSLYIGRQTIRKYM